MRPYSGCYATFSNLLSHAQFDFEPHTDRDPLTMFWVGNIATSMREPRLQSKPRSVDGNEGHDIKVFQARISTPYRKFETFQRSQNHSLTGKFTGTFFDGNIFSNLRYWAFSRFKVLINLFLHLDNSTPCQSSAKLNEEQYARTSNKPV